ncbi:hypothetical protein BGZ99_005191 [Dissophora globulifera]|uniref:Uncharacterized protein n=1 Tax=Dissophora globulifera TaxID=979702 RepID=A0A9P6RSQ4_9FUNG|nr:hypothetical protein BGZ99_005191 [Dissophora globulifera]
MPDILFPLPTWAHPSPHSPNLSSQPLHSSSSAPVSPHPDDVVPGVPAAPAAPLASFPPGTDIVSISVSAGARPPRPLSAAPPIRTDSHTLRNTRAGGRLTSPTTSIPGASYFPHYATITTSSTVNDTTASSAASDAPVVSTIQRSNSGGDATATNTTDKKSQQLTETIRPVYHPFTHMSLMLPPRPLSFANASSSLRVATLPVGSQSAHNEDSSNSALLLSSHLRKSQATGKAPKKSIKSKLRKLRRKQGLSSPDASAAFLTSGDSDSEPAFSRQPYDPEPDTVFNSGGIAYKMGSSTTGSRKSFMSSRSKVPLGDSGLPPQLPPRNGSSSTNNSNVTTGYTKGGHSGSEHGHETHKESSTVRFKDLFKNVSLSHQHTSGPASASPSTSDHYFGFHVGSTRPLQSRSTFHALGDFLSGDDQPSNSKGFRLKGSSGRRKKRFTKKASSAAAGLLPQFATGATDDEDSSAPKLGQHRPHRPHSFLHSLHPRHRSRSIGEQDRQPIVVTWTMDPPLSAALKEARKANPDPNVLLEELEPLPTDFVQAFHATPASKYQPQHQQYQSYQLPHNHAHHPSHGSLAPHFTPSLTSSGFSALYSAPIGAFMGHQSAQPSQRPVTKFSECLITKTFLFKSYENSKFQGHYIFRVVGDRVEYKKLSLSSELDHACSQYFREAYVTYRALEKKAKALKDEQSRRNASSLWTRSQEFEYGQRDVLPASIDRSIEAKGRSWGYSGSSNGSNLERRHSGGKILKSATAWDQIKFMEKNELSESPMATPEPHEGRTIGFSDQRYNPQSSSNALLRSMTGGSDRIRDVRLEMDGGAVHKVSSQPLPQRSPLYLSRRRSFSSIDEQRRGLEDKQEAKEAAWWKEMERKHREEHQHSIYGLEMFLKEITKGSEYERFDIVCNVAIVNDNRNAAVFSILNGDRTNVMWLESPSVKLKDEFLNWIAIGVMDHEVPENEQTVSSPKVLGRSSLDMYIGGSKGNMEEDFDDSELLVEMIEIRLSHQLEKLQAMRGKIHDAMQQIDGCLGQLNRLDDGAKKLMTTMIRAIDSQDVQVALRPSPSTGLTLAATVEKKLNDVQERILVCKRIMDAARFNLNRLRYEIELEQRSIRLFRQYKIIITVISISIVFLLLYLYQSRTSALAPQPPSPLFAVPIDRFEQDYSFHHGDPSVMTPPSYSIVPSTSPAWTSEEVADELEEPSSTVQTEGASKKEELVSDERAKRDSQIATADVEVATAQETQAVVSDGGKTIEEIEHPSQAQDRDLYHGKDTLGDNMDTSDDKPTWIYYPELSQQQQQEVNEDAIEFSQVPCELLPVPAQMDCMVSGAMFTL